MRRNYVLLLCLIACSSSKQRATSTNTQLKSSPTETVVSHESTSTQKPMLLWPDRRPIGMIMLASYIEPYRKGNRQWKLGGLYQFSKEALMKHADQSIANMKTLNAQGMVTWDIEGQEYPTPVSYVGDPTLLNRLAPEMNTLADAYFKRFTDQGFKVGICIRPDSLVLAKGWAYHYSVKDALSNMIRKIAYAQKRWGCTLFYVDSNVWPGPDIENNMGLGGLMAPVIFKDLAEKFPDCLIMPEHEGEGDYWKFTAPYGDLQHFRIDVPRKVKATYPKSFQVLIIGDATVTDVQLQHSVQEGNILMFRAWYPDPVNERIRRAYQKSGNRKYIN